MSVLPALFLGTPCTTSACKGQKRPSDLAGARSHTGVRSCIWVLGIRPGSSGQAASALNRGASALPLYSNAI